MHLVDHAWLGEAMLPSAFHCNCQRFSTCDCDGNRLVTEQSLEHGGQGMRTPP